METDTVKINIVVNNILLRHLEQVGRADRDAKMRLLLALAEFIHGSTRMISTRRLARILLYLGLLFDKVEPLQQAPFLMGSIFTLGGLLKIEVRNYLQTKAKYDPDFRLVCPLVEDSKASEDTMQRYKRDLSDDDIAFFEAKDGFLQVVTFFIKLLTKGKRGVITAQDFNYYLDFTQFEYGELFDEEKKSKPELVGRFETSHYILCWLFDLLQFCFQYLVMGDKRSEQPSQPDQARRFFDPTAPLTIADDFAHPTSFCYYVENFGDFISLLCDSLETLCPQADYMMRMW